MENQIKASVGGDLEPKKSVLFIDDCLDSLCLGKTLLEAEGFSVFTASSGREALRVLREIEQPNLILLDMQMPDMTGAVFLEKLDKMKPQLVSSVPVVFYSAVDALPNCKAVGLIKKAGDMAHFIRQVHRYIDLH